MQEAVLRFLPRFVLLAGLCGLLALPCGAQTTSKVSLDTSETLFTVLAAINACAYDQEVAASDPVRLQVRAEVAEAIAASPQAAAAHRQVCDFYRDHQQPEASRTLAQYVSLALYLDAPPEFAPNAKEADFPPDAAYVLGLAPLLKPFYAEANLAAIWKKHQREYEGFVESYHQPVSRMLLETDVYLKLQFAGYLGRRFVVYLDPLAAPSQVNARNYGPNYFVVISPAGPPRMEAVRHTYLHYVLDTLTLKRANALVKLQPLLEAVKAAPMDESFKHDVGLLLIESLIRALEARTMIPPEGTPKNKVREVRERKAEDAVREGFVLARYFFSALERFEESPVGIKDAFGDMLHELPAAEEIKRAREVEFAAQAAPEVVAASRPGEIPMLTLAEDRLARGDTATAQQLARQALEIRREDPARALFVLARAATREGNMEGARLYFERTLELAREPRLVAWAHIYLGRIFDLQENRDAAVSHYRAALAAGDTTPDTRAAAERGLAQPYEPQAARP